MTDPNSNQARRRTDAGRARELVAFRIGAQEFCVDIMSVREIRGWTPATALPQTPSFVRGVVNLRGAVLPIVDLAAGLGFAAAEPTARHVIIVAQIAQQVLGLLVDAVSDILTVTGDLLQPTPDVASDMAKTFVRGVLAIDKRMISLISLDHVLPPAEREAAGAGPRSLVVKVLASDIDPNMLAEGKEGVYAESFAEAVPAKMRHRWLLPATDSARVGRCVRIADELRELVTFRELNCSARGRWRAAFRRSSAATSRSISRRKCRCGFGANSCRRCRQADGPFRTPDRPGRVRF